MIAVWLMEESIYSERIQYHYYNNILYVILVSMYLSWVLFLHIVESEQHKPFLKKKKLHTYSLIIPWRDCSRNMLRIDMRRNIYIIYELILSPSLLDRFLDYVLFSQYSFNFYCNFRYNKDVCLFNGYFDAQNPMISRIWSISWNKVRVYENNGKFRFNSSKEYSLNVYPTIL